MQDKEVERIKTRVLGSFKDQVEGIDDNDIFDFAVKIGDREELLKLIMTEKRSWEQYRDEFDCEDIPYVQTKIFTETVEEYTTLSANQAVHNEEWAMLRYSVANAEDPDVAKTKMVKWLIEWVDFDEGEDVTQIQIGGEQGSGKTELAFLLAELWLMMNPNGEILTNVKGVDQTTNIVSRDELAEWLDENQGTPFIFVLDELNKHASGSDHQKVMEQLFSFVTYLRKKKGNYIIMGHTGNDIHPWIRELCDYVYKKSNKVAEVYKGIDSKGEGEGHIKTLRGIPKSSLNPDTFDETDWEWGDEQVRQCIGSNSDGERCGAVTRSDWGEEAPDLFCDSHQNQDEPHPDVDSAELVGTEYEGFFEDHDEEEGDQDLDGEDGQDSEDSEDAVREDSAEDDQQGDEQGDDAQQPDTVDQDDRGDGSVDSQPQGSEQSQADLSDVPQHFFDKIEDQTGGLYTKEAIEDIDQLKQLLTEDDLERLDDELEEQFL